MNISVDTNDVLLGSAAGEAQKEDRRNLEFRRKVAAAIHVHRKGWLLRN